MLEEQETTPEQAATATEEKTQEQAENIVEDVKEEVDKRDSEILAELKNIHNAINAQTEHHIRHLEAHTARAEAIPEKTEEVTEEVKHAPEAVSLEIEKPKDIATEKKPEKKQPRRAHGKRR